MNSDNSPEPTPPSPGRLDRRASYAPGQKLSELFGRSPAGNSGNSAFPGSMAAAAANASAHQRRRLSVSSIGLSGTSPTQTSPFIPNRTRKESQSSNGSAGGADESAIDESGDAAAPGPSTPFTRRLSFGARAMRDARAGSGGIFGNGEGFSFSDQMRSRAERTSMSLGSSPTLSSPPSNPFRGPAPKAATSTPAPSAPEPPKEIPKSPRAPDHFQERILKGDFYMD